MDMSFLIYDRFPVIRKGLGLIVSKAKPNSSVLISNTLDDFFAQLVSVQFDLIIADIMYEKNNALELIDFIIPFLNDKSKFILLVENTEDLNLRKFTSISPYFFVLNKNSSENLIVKKIEECLFYDEIR